MFKVHIFNPDHDLALANGTALYTGTQRAQQMSRDLKMLPISYANYGDFILVDNEVEAQWVIEASRNYNFFVRPVTLSELLHLNSDYQIEPWGWNKSLYHRLRKKGIPPNNMIPEGNIDQIRELSHRRTTIEFNARLREKLRMRTLPPLPVEFTTFSDVYNFATHNPGCFVKMPWSGSGKGIYHATDWQSSNFRQWCEGALKSQGSLLCEVGLNKCIDFSLQLMCDYDDVNYYGCSLFNTDSHNQYKSTLVAYPDALMELLENEYKNMNKILVAIDDVAKEMIAPKYYGPLGIDMLLYTDPKNGKLRIAPCVELNFRHTMGMVAMGYAELIDFRPNQVGKFAIEQLTDPRSLLNPEIRVMTRVDSNTKYAAVVRKGVLD